VTEPAARGAVDDLYCPTCERAFAAGELCPDDGTRLVRLVVADDPFVGRDLDGRYTIVGKLGEGGMGTVYRATQLSVEREVAVKIVAPHHIRDRDAIRRFLREAKLASKLAHPNAVAVLDFASTSDGVFYLVMELVDGETLDTVLERDGKLEPARAIRIATQVCDVLEAAHALQIVHRDLKPANIMLSGRDRVKVLDFGLAKSFAPDRAGNTMTQAGEMLGTPAYLAPEIALGNPCDGRVDLYSLGCMLYRMLSGRLPFDSASPHELVSLQAFETAPVLEDVAPAIAAVVARLLAKAPDDRYASAEATRAALVEALDSGVVETQMFAAAARSQPIEVTEPVRRQGSGGRRTAMAIGAVVAVAAIAVGVVAWSGGAVEKQPITQPQATPQPTPQPQPTPPPTPQPTPQPTPTPTPQPTPTATPTPTPPPQAMHPHPVAPHAPPHQVTIVPPKPPPEPPSAGSASKLPF
jgi:serine/threonine-protein kinase